MANAKKRKPTRRAPSADGTWNEPSPRNNIRNWRLFRNFASQQELAKATKVIDPHGKGLQRGTICRLESGDLRYTEEKIEMLAKTLQVTPRDLIGTNPYNAGDIFAIYARLPPRDQAVLSSAAARLKPEN